MAALSTTDPVFANSSDLNDSQPTDQDIARRLLADEGVQSVTIDRLQDRATVHYRDAKVEQNSLSMLAATLRRNQQRLEQAPAISAPRLLCWPDEATGRVGFVREPVQAVGWRRAMHLTLAGVWFTLAVIGAILPGIPTTCFLLMCSYSLLRSSHRLHNRLLNSRVFGPSLRHWRLYRGVRPGVKTKALSMMAVVVGATLYFSGLPTAALLGIAGFASIGAVCVMRLRVVEV